MFLAFFEIINPAGLWENYITWQSLSQPVPTRCFHPSIFPSFHSSIFPSFHLSIFPSFHLFIFPSFHSLHIIHLPFRRFHSAVSIFFLQRWHLTRCLLLIIFKSNPESRNLHTDWCYCYRTAQIIFLRNLIVFSQWNYDVWPPHRCIVLLLSSLRSILFYMFASSHYPIFAYSSLSFRKASFESHSFCSISRRWHSELRFVSSIRYSKDIVFVALVYLIPAHRRGRGRAWFAFFPDFSHSVSPSPSPRFFPTSAPCSIYYQSLFFCEVVASWCFSFTTFVRCEYICGRLGWVEARIVPSCNDCCRRMNRHDDDEWLSYPKISLAGSRVNLSMPLWSSILIHTGSSFTRQSTCNSLK